MGTNTKNSVKNKIKRALTLLVSFSMMLICLMVISLKPTFAATSTIEYDGKNREIIFDNISETDLFSNFKGVMPGDVRSQEIVLKSNPVEHDASFYLKAECDEETRNLLKDVILKLDVNGNTILENSIMFDQVKLGTIEGKKEVPLTVTIKFPATMGNEIAGQELHVKWHITVQEDGKEIAHGVLPSGKPPTGDSNNEILLWILILVGAIFTSIVIYKKSNKE